MALAAGVNHLDVAPQYGRAQELLGPLDPRRAGPALRGLQDAPAHGDGVRAQLEESLRLLRCDHFDLYQMHAVTDLAELDARAGAVEAILAARDEGLCRWVGITGHDLTAPAAHLEALRRYDLDTVMFPVNPQLWSDPAYRGMPRRCWPTPPDHDVGVMAIKAAAARPWGTGPQPPGTWYEPYTAAGEVDRGRRLRPVDPRGPCLLHSRGHWTSSARPSPPPGPTRRWAPAEREAAVAVGGDEPSIFPMPAA